MNPKVKSDLEFFPFDGEFVHVYDPVASRHFKMGPQEVSWLRLLDGSRSLDDLRPSIPQEHFDDFFRHLERLGLLEGGAATRRRRDPLKIKFRLLRPNAWLDGIMSTAVLYRQLLTIFFLPLLAINGLLLALQWQQLQKAFMGLHFGFVTVVTYLLCLILIGFVHEFSHAMVAKSRGANVPAIGMMLFYLQPAFYADISGIALLRNRAHRIEALLAGVQSNNVLSAVFFVGFFLANGTAAAPYMAFAVAINAFLTVYNLVPFVELDGYYILLELLGEPQFGVNAKRVMREKAYRKPEYVLYFALSQIFALAIVFGAVLALRGFALQFTKAPAVDYATIAAMVIAYLILALRTARTVPAPLASAA